MIRHPQYTAHVKGFLFGLVNKEFLIFLFFLALSCVFWLLMTLNENYERELRIPVRISSIPKNVVITSQNQDTITMSVKDKGFVLLAYLTNRQIPVNVNFETYSNKVTGKGVVTASELMKLISQQLYGSSRISSLKPDKIEYYFNYGQSKRVPVRLKGRIQPGDAYYLAAQKIEPAYVTIYAHEDVLDSIESVTTTELNVVNFVDTVVRNVPLKTIKGVKVSPSSVKVSLFPDVLTEATVEVPVSAINMPEGKVLRTFPAKVGIHFSVGASLFREVKAEQFRVVADYNELMAHPSDKCNLYLRSYPHTVSKCYLVTPKVDYLIEQQ